jgi:hypothetical protein
MKETKLSSNIQPSALTIPEISETSDQNLN